MFVNPTPTVTTRYFAMALRLATVRASALLAALPCLGQECSENLAACVECLAPQDCDDGLFCNGSETCGANGMCQMASGPCAPGQSCNEGSDLCDGSGGAKLEGEPCDEDPECASEACTTDLDGTNKFCTLPNMCPDNTQQGLNFREIDFARCLGAGQVVRCVDTGGGRAGPSNTVCAGGTTCVEDPTSSPQDAQCQ